MSSLIEQDQQNLIAFRDNPSNKQQREDISHSPVLLKQDFSDYSSHLRSFNIAFWPNCGYLMPFDVNPKKLLKLGFKCIGERKLQCIEPSCAQTVTAPPELVMSGLQPNILLQTHQDTQEKPEQETLLQTQARRFVLRLQESTHNYQCKFNQRKRHSMLFQPEFDLRVPVDIESLVIKSKKLIYLRWFEIMEKILRSHADSAENAEFEQP